MSKTIEYWDEARKKVYAGIKKVSDAVKVTMWPKWKNVILERPYWPPIVTNDWVTVARDIKLEDKLENIWAEFVKEAASKTNDVAWDWTTSTVLLTEAIIKEWLKYIWSWVNPFKLSRWLKLSVEKIVDELTKRAKKIDNKTEIKQVATISAQDESVWELISEIMEEVGKDWVITIEEWQSIWLEKEVVMWMQLEQGYISPYFVSDQSRMESVVDTPHIIITDKRIWAIKEILPILEKLAAIWQKNVVLITEEVEWEALATLILNKIKGILNVSVIKAPLYWDRKKEMLEDIAIITWWQVVTDQVWLKLEEIGVEVLWKADKVITTRHKTTIVWWRWDQEAVDWKISEIKTLIENTESAFDKEKLKERIARLSWWVAVIKVWAATEMEMKNKKFKIEDALNATRAAIEEWVIEWGWVALLRGVYLLDNLKLEDSDEQIWVNIMAQAIKYPARQILDNSWYNWEVVIEKILEKHQTDNGSYWFNSATGKYVELLEDWVIDPVKVIRVWLQEAVSAAWMVLTTEAIIADNQEKDTKNIQ